LCDICHWVKWTVEGQALSTFTDVKLPLHLSLDEHYLYSPTEGASSLIIRQWRSSDDCLQQSWEHTLHCKWEEACYSNSQFDLALLLHSHAAPTVCDEGALSHRLHESADHSEHIVSIILRLGTSSPISSTARWWHHVHCITSLQCSHTLHSVMHYSSRQFLEYKLNAVYYQIPPLCKNALCLTTCNSFNINVPATAAKVTVLDPHGTVYNRL